MYYGCGIIFYMSGFDKDKISNMQRGINSPGYTGSEDVIENKLEREDVDVSSDWGEDDFDESVDEAPSEAPIATYTKKTRWVRNFFLVSVVFLVGAIVFATYIILGPDSGPSSENIELKVIGPISIGGGETLGLQVFIANKNTTRIEDVRLLVEYPEGVASADTGDPLIRNVIDIGDMDPGGIINEVQNVLFFGEENAEKEVLVTLEYRFEGMNQNTTLEKEGAYSVQLSSSPVKIDFDMLSEAIAGEIIDINITIKSEAEEVIEDALLSMSYPYGFALVDASLPPAYGDRVWSIGDLAPREVKELRITGSVEGPEGEGLIFKMEVGTESPNNPRVVSVLYGTRQEVLRIQKPFLGASLVFSGVRQKNVGLEKVEYVVIPEDGELMGQVIVSNNLAARVLESEVTMQLFGSALDTQRLLTETGFFDIESSSVTWSQRTDPNLTVLEPGAKVSLPFTLQVKPSLSSSGNLIIDPSAQFTIKTKGKRFDDVNVPKEVSIPIGGELRVQTKVGISSQLQHVTGPIINYGPTPPQIDKKTTFTVVWRITNKSSAIENVRARAQLPPEAEYTGVVFPKNEKIYYDEKNGDIEWEVGDIEPGVGYTKPSRDVAFQVSYIPNSANFKVEPEIISDVTMEAYVPFTDSELTANGLHLTYRSLKGQ